MSEQRKRGKSDTIYSVLAILLVFFALVSAVSLSHIMDQKQAEGAAANVLLGLKIARGLQLLMVPVPLVALYARYGLSRLSIPIFIACNLIMIIHVPFGTVVGIYGLFAIKKNLESALSTKNKLEERADSGQAR